MNVSAVIGRLRALPEEERNKEIRAALTGILAGKKATIRCADSIRLLSRLRLSGIKFPAEEVIPLEDACAIGDMDIVESYLVHGAAAKDSEEVLSLLGRARASAAEPAAAEKIASIMLIARGLMDYRTAPISRPLPRSYLEVAFEHALWTAAYIINRGIEKPGTGPDLEYLSRKITHNEYSLAVSRTHRIAAVLFKRGTNTYISCGSEKIVFTALTINFETKAVSPAVVQIPAPQMGKFSPSTVGIFGLFQGERGFLPYEIFLEYSSSKDGRPRTKIIQPYVPDCLENYVRGNPVDHLTPQTQLPFILDIAYALNKLHAEGLVHQDLRPGNILRDGRKGYLIDFGLSHLATQPCLAERHRMIYGSYTTPEKIRAVYDDMGADSRGDMYALGCILHQLTNGEPEWFADLQTLWDKIVEVSKRNGEAEREPSWWVNELGFSELRQTIMEKQQRVCLKIEELEAKGERTFEESYSLIIHRLLHPDPLRRLTAQGVVDELEGLQRAIDIR